MLWLDEKLGCGIAVGVAVPRRCNSVAAGYGRLPVGLVNSRKILSLKDRRQDSSARQDRRMHRTIKGPARVRMEGWQARICNTGKEGFFFAGRQRSVLRRTRQGSASPRTGHAPLTEPAQHTEVPLTAKKKIQEFPQNLGAESGKRKRSIGLRLVESDRGRNR